VAPPLAPPRRRRRRRRIVLLGAALLVALLAVAGLLRRPGQPEWHLVWHDDFAAPEVSTSNWNIRDDAWARNEESVDRRANVTVADGALRLTARRQQWPAGGTVRQYTSGYVDTMARHSWKYGRFVMRAKLPTGAGLWPAFWLRSDQGEGEIDVLEAVGGDPARLSYTVHRSTEGGQGKVGREVARPAAEVADWHTYAVQVEPDKITWSVDGKTVFEVGPDRAPWLRSTLDEPMNIRLNLQVGGQLPAYYGRRVTAATVFPARFVIDWVRVYQYR
jgi:beta-glucanase (GH16 family)